MFKMNMHSQTISSPNPDDSIEKLISPKLPSTCIKVLTKLSYDKYLIMAKIRTIKDPIQRSQINCYNNIFS